MGIVVACLSLLALVSLTACQNNMAAPSQSVDTGKTPSKGVVPGQTRH